MTSYRRYEYYPTVPRRSSAGPTIVELDSPCTRNRHRVALASSVLNSRYMTHPSSASTSTSGNGHYARLRASEAHYSARRIEDVNRDVSSRMIAAASDSPPIIPKRDYDSHSSISGRGRHQESRSAALDISPDDDEDQDDLDSMTRHSHRPGPGGPPHPRQMPNGRGPPEHAMVPYGAPPPEGFGPMGPFPMRPPGPPMGPPPLMPAPWMRGPPPFPHPPPHGPPMPPPRGMDPRFSMYADPGVLFTPNGPMVPADFLDGKQKRKKGKKDKKALQRSRSMDQGLYGMQPTPIFPPPMPPPMESPYGYLGPPPPGQFAAPDPYVVPMRPALPPPRPPTEVGSQFGGMRGPPGSILMGQPPPHRETKGSELLMNGHDGLMNGKSATMISDSLSNPSDKKLTGKGYKKSTCRDIWCDSGLTTAIGVIIAIILLGLIIGLALGLTIV